MTLSESWDIFRATVIHADAPPLQLREMKRAYYAGAESMFVGMMSLDDDEDKACAEMDALYEEMTDYAKAIAENRA